MRWEAFFSIYPFSQDREDHRIALLCATIVNTSGHVAKRQIPIELFLPRYLKDHRTSHFVPKSLEQQAREFADFKQRFHKLKSQNRIQ